MLIGDLIETFFAWNSRHRSPATLGFYRTRLKRFREAFNDRDLATLTPLEIDEHLAEAGDRDVGQHAAPQRRGAGTSAEVRHSEQAARQAGIRDPGKATCRPPGTITDPSRDGSDPVASVARIPADLFRPSAMRRSTWGTLSGDDRRRGPD